MTEINNFSCPNIEKELYFLIFKFLENGPCHSAAKVLREDIERNQLVQQRSDWHGRLHDQTFCQFEKVHGSLPSNYLAEVFKRIGPLLQKCYPTSISGVSSLLTKKTFSLLRGEDPLHSSIYISTQRHSAVRNTVTPQLPEKLSAVSIVPMLNGRSLNGATRQSNIRNHTNIYSKYSLHKQSLGHLASVYCVLFDQTGQIVATGADDNLIKLWSATDGRLVATLRGHAAQITDISINKENTFIASGSLDKTVRVWNLENTSPIAVLQGHTGMITSLNFCPSADKTTRYLVSTGGDGHICFWPWCPVSHEFSLIPIRFNEKSRAGAQLLCSSFSSGGSFLVCGSSDYCIRVYKLYPDRPEKVAELENHKDHVDSIMYSNHGDRFLSGSRDGSIMVWSFTMGEWQSKTLDISPLYRESKPREELAANDGVKVIMICWNCNDQYITASTTDLVIRTWNSNNFSFLRSYHGHTDEVFLLEAHPTDPYIFLSGGHDGNINIWSIRTGEKIKTFFNSLEGQGHGAIFDLKFSPTGNQFCATDGHGHLMIYGFGSSNRYEKSPYEQFFHTDYRPIIRDSNNYVLDEQSQTAPHLLPPPFLVDVDGNPHTANYQMLIPGRTSSNLPQLRQQPPSDANLPPLMIEMQEAEAAQRNLLSPGFRTRQNSHSGLLSPTIGGGGVGLGLRESGDVEGVRQENLYISGDITETDAEAWRNRKIVRKNNLVNIIEDELKRLQHGIREIQMYLKALDDGKKRMEQEEQDILKSEKPFLRSNRGRRRGGGRGRPAKVRQLITYTRESAMRTNTYTRSGREVVNLDNNQASSDSEPEDWQGESSETTDSSDEDWAAQANIVRKSPKKSVKRTPKKKTKEEKLSSSEDDTTKTTLSKRSKRKIIKNRKYAESIMNSSEIEKSSSSSASSSSEEEQVNVEKLSTEDEETKPTTRKKPGRPKKVVVRESMSSNDDVESSSKRPIRNRRKRIKTETPSGNESSDSSSYQTMSKAPVKTKKSVNKRKNNTIMKVKKEFRLREPPPPISELDRYLDYYRPPIWLLSKESRKFPYVPQIGDEVYYLHQGHRLYVEAVINENVYDIQEGRQPFNRYDLEPAELCRLVGVLYDVGPPKMCSLKLELIGDKRKRSTKKTITIRFHDMPTIVDFLVLRHIYEKSLAQDWSSGNRFRCIIDDTWYHGVIHSVTPYQDDYPTSSFLCVNAQWDTGEEERLSPWDLEQPDEEQDEDEAETRPVTQEEQSLYKYSPSIEDWPNENISTLAERVAQGLEEFSQEEIAAPFAFPVNVHDYPTYWSVVAFPTDLETIKIRLRNHFYRRMEALLWEVRQLRQNAFKFNEEGSDIRMNATYIVKLLTKFIRDATITNILDLHQEMMGSRSRARKVVYDDHESSDDDEDDDDEGEDDFEDYQVGQAGSSGSSSNSSQEVWLTEAKSLLDFISSKDDAHPFLRPVDPENLPDYHEIISEPIDLSTIRHRLECHQYTTPDAFIHDFRLMFRNSKTYNTDRRSLIYKMTLRLSALFETRCNAIREAYAIQNDVKVHWTRNKSRQKIKPLYLSESINSRGASQSSSKNNDSSKHSDTILSPRDNAIKLHDFVQKSSTRSSEQQQQQSNNSKTSISDDDSITTSLISPDIVRHTLRSGRVSTKKRRYGFESDEEETPVKPKRKRKAVKQLSKKKVKKKNKRTTLPRTQRVTRTKTTVNYCDDYYDDDDDDDNGDEDDNEDEDDKEDQEGGVEECEEESEEIIENSTSDSSNSNTSSSGSEEEEEEEEEKITSVSSRGRVRKVARRFNDF